MMLITSPGLDSIRSITIDLSCRNIWMCLRGMLMLSLMLIAVTTYASEKFAVTNLPITITQFSVEKTLRLELVVTKCTKGENGECRLVVRLRNDQGIVDEQPLTWGFSVYGWSEMKATQQPTVHISRKKSTNAKGQSFTLSFGSQDEVLHEYDTIDVDVIPLKLAGAPFSLLVTQMGGFESVAEAYSIFTVKNNKLRLDFSAEFATAMPQVSSAAVIDLGHDGYDDVVITETWFISDNDGMADTVAFDVFPKQAGKKFKAYALVLGSYRNHAEAFKKKEQLLAGKCFSNGRTMSLLLMSTVDDVSLYPRLAKDIFFLGNVFSSKDQAQRQWADLKVCDPTLEGYVKRVR